MSGTDRRVEKREGLGTPADLWVVVLAGGEGVRLRPLTLRICGDDRPKQFAPVLGSRSLLDQTLDRVLPLAPPDRTVVVGMSRHASFLSRLAERRGVRILLQPSDRGTAAGVLYPVHWIAHRSPGGIVAVFPSDHLVLEAERFVASVRDVAAWVRRDPRWIVLLGAPPTDPETEYGWIEPGEPLGDPGDDIRRVSRFWEKPSSGQAQRCFEAGCLWNTFVFTGQVERLIEAGRDLLPALHERLLYLRPWAGTEHETWALQQAYALAPRASFSDQVLAAAPGMLAVRRLPPLTWCDLGTPDRVFRTLRLTGLRPAWLPAEKQPA
jgi:mannose-1-phosphate guanylyltransferase